jgi:hypothetical protein
MDNWKAWRTSVMESLLPVMAGQMHLRPEPGVSHGCRVVVLQAQPTFPFAPKASVEELVC